MRERPDDIPALAEHFLSNSEEGDRFVPLPPDVIETLLAYDYPGNVRELRNIVIRLTTKYAGQRLSAVELEAELDVSTPDDYGAPELSLPNDPEVIVEQAQRHLQRERGFSLD
ncbi:MAG TPA: hypothetical protein VK972_00225, partial [Wenzhouxiangella sp.]|nr:hypothetical protein [Wenzhouxiangella sp.]